MAKQKAEAANTVSASRPAPLDIVDDRTAASKLESEFPPPHGAPPALDVEEQAGPVPESDRPDAAVPAPSLTYESRIHIVEAWQYTGQIGDAPPFVDRNWVAWADLDQSVVPPIPAGPALRVPTLYGEKLCRAGDYVVRQTTTLVDGLEPEENVDVWKRDDFERLFIPRRRQRPPALDLDEGAADEAA